MARFDKLKDSLNSRCVNTSQLEVHHKNRGLTENEGLNDSSNAEVLCKSCHDNVKQRLDKPEGNPEFSDEIKTAALKGSGNRCECTRKNCH
ncbi:MAG: HNH endonuclease [Bdellovibrionales bacterium]|nr:HNH endonuclease [Bdellovibrionales bacterium]